MPAVMRSALKTIYTRWLERPIRRLGVARKFGCSYGLAIGIAVVGTAAVMAVGEYYETYALKALTLADRQQHLLAALNEVTLEMRSHPQRLLPALGKPIWFSYEKVRFQANVDEVQRYISSLENLIDRHPDILDAESEKVRRILQTYTTTTTDYTQWVNEFWQKTDPSGLARSEIPPARQKLFCRFESVWHQ